MFERFEIPGEARGEELKNDERDPRTEMMAVSHFGVGGFRPGGRFTFLSGKVNKTSDALFGKQKMDRTQDSKWTNSLHSDKARRKEERPPRRPNSRCRIVERESR